MAETSTPLTAQERGALRLAAQGLTDATAARHHHTCDRTYRRHLESASTKLGARNRTHAAALAVALGIVAIEDLR